MKKQIISTKNAPSAVGPYVQGIKAGNTDKAVERLTIEYDWGVRCEARAGRMFLLWGDSVTEQYVHRARLIKFRRIT